MTKLESPHPPIPPILFYALALTLTLAITACGAKTEPTTTPATRLDLPPLALPTSPPSATPPPTALPTPLPSATPPEPTPTLPPAATPAPTAAPASWYQAGVVALFSVGDYSSGDLYALESAGSTRLILSGIGRQAQISPDGRWLGCFGPTKNETLELHDVETGENRLIKPGTSGLVFDFAFDHAGRRLAYLDQGEPTESGVPWALVIMDLEKNTTSRYDALMTSQEGQFSFLPGWPVGWSGVPSDDDQLIINTFLPYSGGGFAGVWGVTLPPDSAPAQFDTLPLRELVPGAPVYLSRPYLSPDGQNLAFVGRDLDYMPENYFPEFLDFAVNRLEIASLGDGARTLLVEASDGSALGNVLAWSPAGERLLFIQGRYEGENFSALTLKSSDLDGVVTEYSTLTLPPFSALSDLAWCNESLALYVLWDGSANEQRLYSLDLSTGLSTELTTGSQIQIAGCAP